MNDLLAAVTAPANVNLAWRHLRRDRAPWSPTVDREALGHNLPLHLLELAENIATQSYRPLSVRQYAIAKPSGGQRVLSLYFLRDKLAQRMVQQVLEPLLEPQFHPDSFGYRPRRGVASALARVRERHATGLVWGVHADIESFFDRVPHRLLRRVLRRTVPERRLVRLIDSWLEMGPHPGRVLAPRCGLLQGAVISPLLCNLYLNAFDWQCAAANIAFVRYADDFLLQVSDEAQALAALRYAEQRLDRLSLRLRADKTEVGRLSPKMRFLGEPVLRRWRKC